MRAVIAAEPGGPEVLSVGELPDPEPGPGEVLLDVAATAVNRADLLQRQGFYPPPPGASDVLGLECSGTVAEVGDGVDRLGGRRRGVRAAGRRRLRRAGRRTGGAADAGARRRRPGDRGRAARGGVHGVVQRVHDGRAAARRDVPGARWRRRHRHVRDPARRRSSARGCSPPAARRRSSPPAPQLGADVTINYRDQDFVEVVRAETDGAGVDVILDNMGAKYLGRNVEALAAEGRLVVIGMQGGAKGELDLATLFRKRGAVIARAAAQPAGRGEGRDLRVGRRARVAAGRRRAGPPDRARHACRSTEIARGAPADGGRRATPARSCSPL